ncbi:MAG: AlpA family phage regulatory protein [Xanthobacteraceae bacterium]
MRLLDYADLCDRGIKYSRCQLWRLWKEGRFPRPVKLSVNRNAWAEADVDEWISARIAERDHTPAAA